MSTRRTTRAASKAASASSRGASPTVTESDIPNTPSGRRNRRSDSATPLPTIAGRSSTAYGTNTTHQPASLKIPEAGQEINSAIDSILQPRQLPTVREENTPTTTGRSNGGRGSTVSRRSGPRAVFSDHNDRSFGTESRIFGDAGFETSSLASSMQETPQTTSRPLGPIGVNQRSRREREQLELEEKVRREREQVHRDRARTHVDRVEFEHIATNTSTSFADWKHWIVEKTFDVGVEAWFWFKNHWKTILLTFAIALVLLNLLFSGSYRWYGLDMKHNVGQFVPDFVAHPVNTFGPNEISTLKSRVKAVEYDIAYLKKRNDIDEKAITRLSELLPAQLIVKKTKGGKLEITQDFWHALDAKMRSENAYLHPEAAGKTSEDASFTDVSLRQIESLMEKSKMWDRYLQNNRAQLKEWAGEEFDARFPEKFKKSIEINKSEFVDLVRESWAGSQEEVKREIRRLSTELEDTVSHIGSTGGNDVGHTKEQIKAISTDVFRSLFSNAQLEALARANKNINNGAANDRIDHFSPSMGATVNPILTSDNFMFPSMDMFWLKKKFYGLVFHQIPSPNPPVEALKRWEEPTECWCSPSKGKNGFGTSLALELGNNIYPDQITIEHVQQSASPEPGSTPKDMELLAYIEDEESYHAIKRKSEATFYEESSQEEERPEEHPFGYVRIGTWTYESDAISNIQSFPLQIELGSQKGAAYTRKLIVRAKNNWGAGEVGYTCLYRVRLNGEFARI